MATVTGTRTIPWDWYVDPAVLRLEQERIFRRTWQYAGHTGDVSATRVVRHDEGRRRADRPGARPRRCASGRSSTSAVTVGTSSAREPAGARRCSAPITRGPTTSTGRSAARRGRRRSRASTRRGSASSGSPSDTWGPFVFVNPDPAAGPLAEHLGDLPRLVAEGGVDVERTRLRPAGRGRVRRELEGVRGELPRVLPLRRRASELLEGHRRRAGRVLARGAPDLLEPVRPAEKRWRRRLRRIGRGRAGPVPPPVPGHDDQRDAGAWEPLDRAGACRSEQSERTASSTTSSCPAPTSSGSPTTSSSTTRSVPRIGLSSSGSRSACARV